MGGCCGKVAPTESAVILKVKNVLAAKDEDMQLARGAMLLTLENCLETHGGWHPVSAIACWALSRVYNILAKQASSDEEK